MVKRSKFISQTKVIHSFIRIRVEDLNSEAYSLFISKGPFLGVSFDARHFDINNSSTESKRLSDDYEYDDYEIFKITSTLLTELEILSSLGK